MMLHISTKYAIESMLNLGKAHSEGVAPPLQSHTNQGVTVLPANLRNKLLSNTTTGFMPNKAHHLICPSSSFPAVTLSSFCQALHTTQRIGTLSFYICLL